MTFRELSWGALLDDVDRIGRQFPYVFFSTCPTSEGDRCLVVDDEDLPLDDDDIPEVARRSGFTRDLLVSDVEQVIDNLRQQRANAGRPLLLRAIAHYYEHDAFIDVSVA